MALRRSLSAFAVLLSVLVGLAASPAKAYEGGALKNHNHSSSAGDGGQLSNLTLLGTTSVSTLTITTSFGLGGTTMYAAGVSSYSLTTDSAAITVLSNQINRYRKPSLFYVSATEVDVETGTVGTVGATTVIFPDGTVYTETSATLLNAVITSTANWGNGTQRGGLRLGEVLTGNTAENFYFVKSTATGNSTDFVTVISSWQPTPANFAQLTTNFCGTSSNCWEYGGVISYGDGNAAPNSFPTFKMSGNAVTYTNSNTGNGGIGYGIRMATTAGATTLTWSPATGTNFGAGQLPAQVKIGSVLSVMSTSTNYQIADGAATINLANSGTFTTHLQVVPVANMSLPLGIKVTPSGSTAQDIFLTHYIDSALGVGSNPQL